MFIHPTCKPVRARIVSMKLVCSLFCAGIWFCSLPAPAQSEATDPLFQALGGREGIKAIVDDFLQLTVNDVRIKKQFEDADIPHLAMRLNEQFCELSGGPCKYGGKDMKTIHADTHITNAQFNALVEDLQAAMDKHGVPTRDQNKLLAKLAPMQHSVVTQ